MQVIKNFYPDLDEMSLGQACTLVGTNGRRWLEHHIAEGHLHPMKRGKAKNSKLIFSRVEILALKKAEEENYKTIKQYK